MGSLLLIVGRPLLGNAGSAPNAMCASQSTAAKSIFVAGAALCGEYSMSLGPRTQRGGHRERPCLPPVRRLGRHGFCATLLLAKSYVEIGITSYVESCLHSSSKEPAGTPSASAMSNNLS